MRDIKFRGQRVDTKEWVYGWLVRYYNILYICTDERRDVEPGEFSFQRIEVIPETVGQYTGLKDKNGVEIYEGDIINGREIVFAQYFNHQGYYLKEVFNNGKFRLLPIINQQTFKVDGEVIGNIYENPELLDENKNDKS